MMSELPEGGCWDAEFRKAQGDVKTVIVVAAVLVDIDGRVLVAQRPEGKAMAGLWEFPGGKLEPGELPETALVRELNEELGIDLTESCLAPLTFASHLYEDFHLLMPVYVARQWSRRASTVRPSNGCSRRGFATSTCRRQTNR